MKPYYDIDGNRIYLGDALSVLKSLPDESVHCCVTSPPYWGLRDYGIEGQLGLEETPELFIQHMVEIFREVRRVLRSDAVLFLNLGDSYAGSGGTGTSDNAISPNPKNNPDYIIVKPAKPSGGLKPKDLCGIPWRVALALQADGWWLRSDIIWAKPNPMPESVTDRPTKAHEYIFLLTKSAKYFYDAEAVKEQANDWGMRDRTGQVAYTNGLMPNGSPHSGCKNGNFAERGRNKRTVWTIPTQPFSGAHFAVFPEKLIEPCILAGTSEKGCCAECGSPWERVVEKHKADKTNPRPFSKPGNEKDRNDVGRIYEETTTKTTGWQPTCKCGELKQDKYTDGSYARSETWYPADTTPCTVLDPFFGSGTTGIVAHKHGRKFVGIELSQKYLDEIAIPRIDKATKQLRLFN